MCRGGIRVCEKVWVRMGDVKSRGVLLVVEDDPQMRGVLKEVLINEGYTVFEAYDGVNALEVLRKLAAPPDMIIADIMMPRMDGFELLRRVREAEAWMHVPVTFLTALDNPKDMLRGKELGAEDYITKPFLIGDFLKLIDARLKRYHSLRQLHDNRVQSLKRDILQLLNHEFRTPLTLIVAYTNMIRSYEQAETMPTPMLIEFLAGVCDGAQRLRRLIENFVLLAELQYGDGAAKLAWRMREIDDARAVFVEAIDSLTRDEQRAQRNIVIDISPDLPAFTGDTESLVVALRELLDNAVKFSAEGSTITLGAWLRDGHITLSVSDEGRGMPSGQLARIGAAFYQIDRHSTEDQGVGVGLAIVDAIAKLHDARVHITSREGQGTTVQLVLPLDHLF